MKKSGIITIGFLLLSSWHAVNADIASSQVAVSSQQVVENPVEMIFIDISGFDEDLSSNMKNNRQKIVVDFPGNLQLSDMPPRLDQWLSQIKTSGGKVQAKEIPKPGDVATRGFFWHADRRRPQVTGKLRAQRDTSASTKLQRTARIPQRKRKSHPSGFLRPLN